MGQFESVQAYGPYTLAGAPAAGSDEIQTITMTGSPTSGTFRLSFDGFVTGAINWNDGTAGVETALNALPPLASGGTSATGVAVTGGGFWTAMVVTFSGTRVLKRSHNLLVLAVNALAGGSSPSITLARSTTGVVATYRNALKGALLIDTTNAQLYQASAAGPAPAWGKVGTQS